jgi:small subunit ribosomal protein S3
MIEKKFIKENIKKLDINNYFEQILDKAEYSHTDIKITPLSTKIVIYVGKPGIAIGKGGKTIKDLTETLQNEFDIKNPQLDIKMIDNLNLDANVIAKNIADALEKGMKSGRLINIFLRKIMSAGAVGAEITISGKISGARGRSEKVLKVYIKKCGDMANEFVEQGYKTAVQKQGLIGIKVKILPFLPKSLQIEKEIKSIFNKKEEEIKKTKEIKESEPIVEEDIVIAEEIIKEKQETKKEDKTTEKKETKKTIKPKKEKITKK